MDEAFIRTSQSNLTTTLNELSGNFSLLLTRTDSITGIITSHISPKWKKTNFFSLVSLRKIKIDQSGVFVYHLKNALDLVYPGQNRDVREILRIGSSEDWKLAVFTNLIVNLDLNPLIYQYIRVIFIVNFFLLLIGPFIDVTFLTHVLGRFPRHLPPRFTGVRQEGRGR